MVRALYTLALASLLAGCLPQGQAQAPQGQAQAPPEPVAAQSELADRGKRHFIRCNACHSTKAGGLALAGPHLSGIVGRPVAALRGFAYTDELRALDLVWDEAALDRLLTRPSDILPGLCLPFTGLDDPAQRRELIAFLASQGG